MIGPLDGPRAKVARARNQLKAFDQKLAALRKPKAKLITIRRYFDADDQSWVLRLVSIKALDIQWAVRFGEIAHDLRSALDQMTYALAVIDSNGRPREKVQFPLVSRPSEFNGNKVQKVWLKGLTVRHRQFIARCQPYRVKKGDPNPMALLEDLSNDDKHRVLQPSAFFAGELSYTIDQPAPGASSPDWTDCVPDPTRVMTLNFRIIPVEPDTEMARIPIIPTGPNPKVQVKVNASLYIAFRNGIDCYTGLVAIVDRVETILNDSAVEFARPQAQRRWRLPSSRFGPADWEIAFTHTVTPPG